MSGQINNNPQQNDYYAQLASKNLSTDQLRHLDALNGALNDRTIDKDVFTIADSIIKGVPLEGEICANSALINQVQKIMRGEFKQELIEQWGETPRGNTVEPNTVRQFLCLSADQTEALTELSASRNGGIQGIDKQVFIIAESIVNQKPIQCDEGLWQQISEILQGPPPEPRGLNRQFGL